MKSVSLASPLAPLRSAFRPTRTPSSPRGGCLFTGPPLNAQNIPVSITGPKGQLLSIHCERFNNPVRRCALRLVKCWERPFCFECGNPSHTQTQTEKHVYEMLNVFLVPRSNFELVCLCPLSEGSARLYFHGCALFFDNKEPILMGAAQLENCNLKITAGSQWATGHPSIPSTFTVCCG